MSGLDIPGARLEPARSLPRGILSPLCLPVPPPGPGRGIKNGSIGPFAWLRQDIKAQADDLERMGARLSRVEQRLPRLGGTH